MEQPTNSKSSLHPEGVDEALNAVRHTLGTLRRWRCKGFPCSDQALEKLNAWTTCATAGDPEKILNGIRSELVDCKRCSLSLHRKHILFGQGNPNADLVFVRQAPSSEEDISGRYYQGPEGQLLLKIIGAMKMTPEQVYICNIVKCSGQSKSSDIRTCLPFLKRQLKAIDPKVICALGEGPSQILLDRSDTIETLRGRFFNVGRCKIVPTFDPAFLMTHPEDKRKAWEDLKKIMAYLAIPL